ncbi:MAG: alpha-mannosidase [Anaerolineae bacterium]|nr:alpha-mannosidase [Anaerolineae bacterium]
MKKNHSLLDVIKQRLQDKIDEVRHAASIKEWHFALSSHGGSPLLSPASSIAANTPWKPVKLPHRWSTFSGEGWFSAVFSVPREVAGVNLAGDRLELELFLTTGAALYLNGDLLVEEPSWLDTRAALLLLCEGVQTGQEFELALRCHCGDGLGLLIKADLHFSRLDRLLFALDLLCAQIAFVRFLSSSAEGAAEVASEIEREAFARFDLDALGRNDWESWWTSVERAHEVLSVYNQWAKSYVVYLVAHSHIDMNWLWPWQETLQVCRRDFEAALSLMERWQRMTFSQSQAAIYQAMEKEYPQLFEKIRQSIDKGNWDVTASTWVEGDLNISCGEAIIRQILYARKYTQQRFGVESAICWQPDTFGHPVTMPQILSQSGIKYYYFCRAGKKETLFWWEGLDGSRVLALRDDLGYSNQVTPSMVIKSAVTYAETTGLQTGLLVFGVGDHGGGVTVRDLAAAKQIDSAPLLPKVTHAAASAFFERALGEGHDIPVVCGEMNPIFEGCYTSESEIKRLNRRLENLLLTAETVEAVASIYGYQPEGLNEAWLTLCLHQFHDILCGCAIGTTCESALASMGRQVEMVEQRIQAKLQRMLKGLSDDRQTQAGQCILVFNPLGWERTDVARIPLRLFAGKTLSAIVDDKGLRLPVQVCGDQLIFIASHVPALGFRRYAPVLAEDDQEGVSSFSSDSHNVLDNGILRIRVNSVSGAIDQFYDYENRREFANPCVGWGPEERQRAGTLNVFQLLWEQPHPMSAWVIGEITQTQNLIEGAHVERVDCGPVFSSICVRHRFLNSTLTQKVFLYTGLRRIDFETTLEWNERGVPGQESPMLRVLFTPCLGVSRATFEVAFAGYERPADGREMPALRWMDISECAENGCGFSLLNDGKYGHQAHGNTLGLTLMRAPYEPQQGTDVGTHHFCYALYPHAGDWKTAHTVQRAAEFNQPFQVVIMNGQPLPHVSGVSLLSIEPSSVVLSAFKLAEVQSGRGTEWIARFYETNGEKADATICLGWGVQRAEEVNLMEEEEKPLNIVDGRTRLVFRPFEIKTVKLYS